MEGIVRLTGDIADNKGVVEYYVDNAWRTICPFTGWSNTEANIVCTSLGYISGTAILPIVSEL